MFNKYINFFLLSKKILTKPEEKKVLIFDEDDAEIISKYFNKNDIEILPIRMAYKPGQKLNIYILFKIILDFKFTIKSYCEEYIKAVKPKIIISLSDNWPIFYRLKKNWVHQFFGWEKAGLRSNLSNTQAYSWKRISKLAETQPLIHFNDSFTLAMKNKELSFSNDQGFTLNLVDIAGNNNNFTAVLLEGFMKKNKVI